MFRSKCQPEMIIILFLYRYKDKYKKFSNSSEYVPVTSKVRGQRSLKTYRDVIEYDTRRQELLQCGLTEEEVNLKLTEDDRMYKDTEVLRKDNYLSTCIL